MKKALVFMLAVLMLAVPVFAQGTSESNSSSDSSKADKLTYWAPLNPNISAVAQDFSQTEYWKEVMKRTNTDIEFQHVSAAHDGVLSEGFNILIASGDYPDIIEYKWTAYPGGPQAAIDDGVIIPLNDIFEKYCPNITAFLESHPDMYSHSSEAKATRTTTLSSQKVGYGGQTSWRRLESTTFHQLQMNSIQLLSLLKTSV